MRIYLVRHGQTEWNHLGRWQGHSDIDLDAVGIQQAQLAAKRFAKLPVTHIYASPLKRAAVTAQVIQSSCPCAVNPIVYRDDLKEITLGEWEGLTVHEVRERYGEPFSLWETEPTADVGFGVESYAMVQARAYAALQQIARAGHEAALVVSHGAWICALFCKLLHIPLNRRLSFFCSNTGIGIVDYYADTDSFRVITMNDFGHLQ